MNESPFVIEIGQDGLGRWHWRVHQVRPIPPNDTVNPFVHRGESRFRSWAIRRAKRCLVEEQRWLLQQQVSWVALGEDTP